MLNWIVKLNHSPYFWRGVARGMGFVFAFAFSMNLSFVGNYIFGILTFFGMVMAIKTELEFDRIIMALESDDTTEG